MIHKCFFSLDSNSCSSFLAAQDNLQGLTNDTSFSGVLCILASAKLGEHFDFAEIALQIPSTVPEPGEGLVNKFHFLAVS